MLLFVGGHTVTPDNTVGGTVLLSGLKPYDHSFVGNCQVNTISIHTGSNQNGGKFLYRRPIALPPTSVPTPNTARSFSAPPVPAGRDRRRDRAAPGAGVMPV